MRTVGSGSNPLGVDGVLPLPPQLYHGSGRADGGRHKRCIRPLWERKERRLGQSKAGKLETAEKKHPGAKPVLYGTCAGERVEGVRKACYEAYLEEIEPLIGWMRH